MNFLIKLERAEMKNQIEFVDFDVLLELMDSTKVNAKMHTDTYRNILGRAGSLTPSLITNILSKLNGIDLVFDNSMKVNYVILILNPPHSRSQIEFDLF